MLIVYNKKVFITAISMISTDCWLQNNVAWCGFANKTS